MELLDPQATCKQIARGLLKVIGIPELRTSEVLFSTALGEVIYVENQTLRRSESAFLEVFKWYSAVWYACTGIDTLDMEVLYPTWRELYDYVESVANAITTREANDRLVGANIELTQSQRTLLQTYNSFLKPTKGIEN